MKNIIKQLHCLICKYSDNVVIISAVNDLRTGTLYMTAPVYSPDSGREFCWSP